VYWAFSTQGIVHAMMYYIYWLGTPDVLCLPVKYIGCIILLVMYTGCIVSTGHMPECEVYQPMHFTDIFADVAHYPRHRLGPQPWASRRPERRLMLRMM
jgi:hypothetical protein